MFYEEGPNILGIRSNVMMVVGLIFTCAMMEKLIRSIQKPLLLAGERDDRFHFGIMDTYYTRKATWLLHVPSSVRYII